jgi:hypothetical protein
MSLIGEIYDLIKDTRGLVEKYHDKEISEKLVEIHGKLIDLQSENESLKRRINELETSAVVDDDLEMMDKGWYIRKSEQTAGKNIRYCVACYQNTGKLYPITQGSMRRDFFCTNCKMHYT